MPEVLRQAHDAQLPGKELPALPGVRKGLGGVMGAINTVEYKADCINCGAPLKGFQSKSGMYDPDGSTVQPEVCEEFYTDCIVCGQWHDYTVTVKEVDIVCVSTPRKDRNNASR